MINYFFNFRSVGPFQRYSRSKSKVVRNRKKFWTVFALPNFRGQAFQKLYPGYNPWLAARRLDKQESPADARVTCDSAIIPRCPSAAILDIIKPQIAPFDPPTPKNPCLEPDMEWIGCTVCERFTFKLHTDLETFP